MAYDSSDFNDPTGYWQRKEQRRKKFQKSFGRKLVKCVACNGSGRYDHNGSPDCWSCDGTGKTREDDY